MLLSPGYTKLSLKNIHDLNTASECICSAANTIASVRPQWGPAVIQLLTQANDIVVGIQNRGASAIARYMEKHGVGRSPEKTEVGATGTETGQESPTQADPE